VFCELSVAVADVEVNVAFRLVAGYAREPKIERSACDLAM
jgi:hypothetical protein